MPGVSCGIRALSRRGTKGRTQRSGRKGASWSLPWFLCQVLEGRQEPAYFSAGTRGGLRSVCQGLARGLEPAWFSAGTGRWAQLCLSGPGHGRDPASFRAGTEMGAQESVLGESNKGQT